MGAYTIYDAVHSICYVVCIHTTCFHFAFYAFIFHFHKSSTHCVCRVIHNTLSVLSVQPLRLVFYMIYDNSYVFHLCTLAVLYYLFIVIVYI